MGSVYDDMRESRPVRVTGWQESQAGHREVRRHLRLVLKDRGVPPGGQVYDRAYAYVREHYWMSGNPPASRPRGSWGHRGLTEWFG